MTKLQKSRPWKFSTKSKQQLSWRHLTDKLKTSIWLWALRSLLLKDFRLSLTLTESWREQLKTLYKKWSKRCKVSWLCPTQSLTGCLKTPSLGNKRLKKTLKRSLKRYRPQLVSMRCLLSVPQGIQKCWRRLRSWSTNWKKSSKTNLTSKSRNSKSIANLMMSIKI